MTAAPALLDVAGFKARTLMSAADVDVVAGFVWKKVAADASAALPLAEQLAAQIIVTGALAAVVFRPLGGLTHDAANYATVTVYKRTGSGAPVIVAQLATTAFDWTASIPVVIPIVAGAVTAGDMLTVQITKTGTGVIVPNGTFAFIPSPSWLDFAIARAQSTMYGRLRKRYATPFDPTNPPEKALDWIVALVDPEAYKKRGVNPSDAQMTDVIASRTNALAEMKEAADSETGLFDLPLLNDEKQSAITQGGPYGYSEQLPNTWTDKQLEQAFENGELDDSPIDGARLI